MRRRKGGERGRDRVVLETEKENLLLIKFKS
jgi:hypothetical protein